MKAYYLTSEDTECLWQRYVGDMTPYIVWRGHDDRYASGLQAACGLPSDLRDIIVACFPDGALAITVSGPSGNFVLVFNSRHVDTGLHVRSLFISPTGLAPQPLSRDLDAIVYASGDMVGRHLDLPHGGVQ